MREEINTSESQSNLTPRWMQGHLFKQRAKSLSSFIYKVRGSPRTHTFPPTVVQYVPLSEMMRYGGSTATSKAGNTIVPPFKRALMVLLYPSVLSMLKENYKEKTNCGAKTKWIISHVCTYFKWINCFSWGWRKKGAALYQATEFVDHISLSVWLRLLFACQINTQVLSFLKL